MTSSEDGEGSAGYEPVEPLAAGYEPVEPLAAQRVTGGTARSRWQAFRMWRRSRPFWGGLLLILAGLEMLAIPLLSVLAHTSVKVVIYIGIGGVFGVLIGGLLAACGLLIWFHPAQRVFYAIAAVLLAVVSFIATNLGGFFVGMLLGVTGGSLSFAWAPLARGRAGTGDAGSDDTVTGGIAKGHNAAGRTARGNPRGDHRRSGGRLTALAATPLILSGLMLPGYLGRPARPAAPQFGCIIYIPIICPPPSPSPSPAAPVPTVPPTTVPPTTVPPAASATATPAATATGTAASGSPQPSASPSTSPTAQPKAAAPAQLAAVAPSSLTANSALLEGLSYDGVAQVATASGTVTMMKFTMTSLTLTGDIALTVIDVLRRPGGAVCDQAVR
jgi:cell division septation protein DedD